MRYVSQPLGQIFLLLFMLVILLVFAGLGARRLRPRRPAPSGASAWKTLGCTVLLSTIAVGLGLKCWSTACTPASA
ncbi:MAG: hypothetical protein U1F06_04305 [Steroidobacteraceae bacterium]